MAEFTLTFSPALDTATYPSLSVSGCIFTTSDNGITYTTNDTPSSLTGFNISPYQSQLVSVENIPSTVTSIALGAFYNCSALTSITIPSTVTSIASYAFAECSALTTVNLVDGLQTIGTDAFRESGLTSIIIPATVTSIGIGAFYNCQSLTIVDLANATGITIINPSTFEQSGLTSITIPSNVTTIGNSAFLSCTSLTSITIPSSVTTFGIDAFIGIPSYPENQSTLQDAATLYTSPLDELTNPVYAYFKQNFIDGVNEINYINDDPPTPPTPIPMVCFLKDSKILTKQGYRPIQDLRNGDLIKTIKHGYLPIDMIGYREIFNPICKERIKDKLYVCSNKEYSEIFEDLVITGCHSILVENYTTQEQLDKSTEVNGGIFETDGKWRLPACVDERAKPYEKEGTHTIYHLALENEDYFMNYGIYANGLVVETCSKRYLKELSNMTILNL